MQPSVIDYGILGGMIVAITQWRPIIGSILKLIPHPKNGGHKLSDTDVGRMIERRDTPERLDELEKTVSKVCNKIDALTVENKSTRDIVYTLKSELDGDNGLWSKVTEAREDLAKLIGFIDGKN